MDNSKKVAVIGLGKAGLADALFLKEKGENVLVWDDKEEVRLQAQEQGLDSITLENTDWDDISYIVLSPGIPHTHPKPHPMIAQAKKKNVPIVGDVELLYKDKSTANFIGITGTNGKSTTTELLHHTMLHAGISVNAGANLGKPAVSLGNCENYVLEMSSYMLELVPTTVFNVALWLNISEDHLIRHGDINDYINAKANIFHNQNSNHFAIICIDDEYSEKVATRLKDQGKQKVITVSSSEKSADYYIKDNSIYSTQDENPLGNLGDYKHLHGSHNAQNAVSAWATLHACGLENDVINQAFITFAGLAHRQQFVLKFNDVEFYNDSKATNAVSTQKAIENFSQSHLLLGGIAKEGGITSIVDEIKSQVAHVYLYGQAREEFAQTLRDAGYTNFSIFDDTNIKMEDIHPVKRKHISFINAIKQAYKDASNKNGGGVVLLAPACASFDMFKSFEDRGNIFQATISDIITGE